VTKDELQDEIASLEVDLERAESEVKLLTKELESRKEASDTQEAVNVQVDAFVHYALRYVPLMVDDAIREGNVTDANLLRDLAGIR
jgi:hypothetical protein